MHLEILKNKMWNLIARGSGKKSSHAMKHKACYTNAVLNPYEKLVPFSFFV